MHDTDGITLSHSIQESCKTKQAMKRDGVERIELLPFGTRRQFLWSLFVTLIWPALASVSLSICDWRDGRDSPWSAAGCKWYHDSIWIGSMDRQSPCRFTHCSKNPLVLYCVGILSTGLLACSAWWRMQVCCLLGIIAGAYVPLKRLVPKNVLTTVAWTAATSTLPFATQPAIDSVYLGTVVAVALIMLANTIVCDLPDYDIDKELECEASLLVSVRVLVQSQQQSSELRERR